MNVIVITPPLVQLNTPYPSGAYLKSYFTQQNCNATWYDLNIHLFYSIFSSSGLTKLFNLSSKKALKMAEQAEKNGDSSTAFNLRRYVSTAPQWISWIDWIVSSLCDGPKNTSTREKAHQFLYSPFVPRGNRMHNHLENLDHQPTVDDIPLLCTLALADLADYITAAYDPNFSLIRYAESLAVDTRTFSQIKNQIDSPILENFYLPILEYYFGRSGSTAAVAPSRVPSEGYIPPLRCGTAAQPFHELTRQGQNNEPVLVCISIPFAGTLLPALYTARYFKQTFGNKVFVSIGGGFVNTELRNVKDKSLADFVDAISFDRGYGSYWALGITKENISQNKAELKSEDNSRQLYKLRRFIKTSDNKTIVTEPLWTSSELQKIEDNFTKTLTPDFSDIDFSIYPRVCDDINPMHRLWTDGAWIKAYLAHGCYWHKCAFCDTQLDYVCAYKPVSVEPLYESLLKTAKNKGVYGLHFVDEALPPVALKNFALLNAKNQSPLYYWGNIRFEKAFTKDLAAFLSYGGFAAVSAGLEVATGEGLININKGIDIDSIVSACAAFKEAGILVHAYMIYGFWNDTPQSIIDSMETLRQLFAAGLLDSAFWHKFVLTKNSTVYTEWQQGKHPELIPLEPDSKVKNKEANKNSETQDSLFAQNNINFKGENQYNKFGEPLEQALNAWMHGEHLETKVQKWFNFQVPFPTVPKNFIEKAIEKYEHQSNKKIPLPQSAENLYWLGSVPVVQENSISWLYLQEEFYQDLQIFNSKQKNFNPAEISQLLWNLRPDASLEERNISIQRIKKSPEFQRLIQTLHNQGIVCI